MFSITIYFYVTGLLNFLIYTNGKYLNEIMCQTICIFARPILHMNLSRIPLYWLKGPLDILFECFQKEGTDYFIFFHDKEFVTAAFLVFPPMLLVVNLHNVVHNASAVLITTIYRTTLQIRSIKWLKNIFIFFFSLDCSTNLVHSIIVQTIGTTSSLENCGNFLSGFTARQKHTVELHLKLLK